MVILIKIFFSFAGDDFNDYSDVYYNYRSASNGVSSDQREDVSSIYRIPLDITWQHLEPPCESKKQFYYNRSFMSTNMDEENEKVREHVENESYGAVLPPHLSYECNKRPLSISSTSSGTSSVSSLPRHQRKKRAGLCVVSSLPETSCPAVAESASSRLTDASASMDEQDGCVGRLSFLKRTESEEDIYFHEEDEYNLDDTPDSALDDNTLDIDEPEQLTNGLKHDCNVVDTAGSVTPTYIEKVVYEILCTERVYVEDLHQIIEVCCLLCIY